jgi:hypothetical protein
MKGFKKLNTVKMLRKARGLHQPFHLCFPAYPKIQNMMEHAEKIYGVKFWFIPKSLFVPYEPQPDHVGTGSFLTDVLYEQREVFLPCDTQVENVMHEIAHMLVASPDQLERVNYGTYHPRPTQAFQAWADSHEEEACDAEVILWRMCHWTEGEQRARGLNSMDAWKSSSLFTTYAQKWIETFPILDPYQRRLSL